MCYPWIHYIQYITIFNNNDYSNNNVIHILSKSCLIYNVFKNNIYKINTN